MIFTVWFFSLDENSTGLNQYGPIFYFGIFYIGTLSLLTLIFTMIPSLANRQITQVILPISILLIWGLYTFLYMIDWKPFSYFKIIFKSAEFNILMVILFIESLAFKRLLPSNRGYESFLKISSLNIGIMDSNDQIIFSPKNYPHIDPKLINKALVNPVVLDENIILESANIKGGKSFWFVDLTDFNKLKSKLLALSEDMLSENELLRANNKIRKNMVKIEDQKEIREYIQLKLKPQFDKLKSIMINLPEDEKDFEKALKYACILGVYIKRYSNLFLLTKNKNTLDLSELRLAFAESLDYLKLSEIKTNLYWQIKGNFDSTACLNLYELFQQILELYLPYISYIDLGLENRDKNLEMKIRLLSSKTFSLKNYLENLNKDIGLYIYEDLKEKEVKFIICPERGVL